LIPRFSFHPLFDSGWAQAQIVSLVTALSLGCQELFAFFPKDNINNQAIRQVICLVLQAKTLRVDFFSPLPNQLGNDLGKPVEPLPESGDYHFS